MARYVVTVDTEDGPLYRDERGGLTSDVAQAETFDLLAAVDTAERIGAAGARHAYATAIEA